VNGAPPARVWLYFPRPAAAAAALCYTGSRQKKPIPFRFPGLRKRRESSISIGSFFLSKSDPLRWALIWE
jgi:hypothetical protein